MQPKPTRMPNDVRRQLAVRSLCKPVTELRPQAISASAAQKPMRSAPFMEWFLAQVEGDQNIAFAWASCAATTPFAKSTSFLRRGAVQQFIGSESSDCPA
jgi:hypothetical protein